MASRDTGLYVFLGAFALSLLAVLAGLQFANRRYLDSLAEQRRARLAGGEGGLVLEIRRVDARLGLDPRADYWGDAAAVSVPVLPQNLAMPALTEASVDEVELRGVSDGRHVLWRLSWEDAAPDGNVDTGRFGDAVAIQLPLVDAASFMMGGPDMQVQIIQWKALWQRDVDEHFQDVQDLHPNFWADLYWFADGPRPYPIPSAFADPRSRQFFPALQAGNPVARWDRRTPVAELSAEGFGSLTAQTAAASTGRGEWRDGRWTVVIARPLATEDAADLQLAPGAEGKLGIAVWEGGAGNVGGRKHYSNWIAFLVGS